MEEIYKIKFETEDNKKNVIEYPDTLEDWFSYYSFEECISTINDEDSYEYELEDGEYEADFYLTSYQGWEDLYPEVEGHIINLKKIE